MAAHRVSHTAPVTSRCRLVPDLPPALGVRLCEGGEEDSEGAGADVAVLAAHADAVDLCLLDVGAADGSVGERRVRLPHLLGGVHFGHVEGVRAGQRYGLRVHGPWDPARGMRHNSAKLLLDPYARAVAGDVVWRPEVFGHVVGADLAGDCDVRDDRDSAPYVPHGVVLGDEPFDWQGDTAPCVPWTDTVIYEAHVRGLTRRLPGVPDELRGTYAGLGHPVTIQHLVDLGVTTVELLPVHAFTSEPALVRRGLTNYWGYNTLGFHAAHPGYAATTDPAAVREEFRTMVRSLHAAGLEVLLDVVYNHTAEQGRDGATLSLRGLDNSTYYRLDRLGRDIDVTGCGNTLDFRRDRVVQLTLDSLRAWVTDYHVDGFRFDLAPALARGRDDGYDPDHPFLVALRTDPVLGRVKLIAEPWDVGPGGWRTFWLADQPRVARGDAGHGVHELATRLSGSQDLFGAPGRSPLASVNFIAAHDGYTLADTTAYESKHNLGNGEGNRDGHGDNRSWNHGAEGRTDDPRVLAERRRSLRNLLGTLLLSTGVPMLCAGDELGRTQRGNNNAYCRDDELSWLDWELAPWQQDLLTTTRHLLRLRREHPVLRSARFFSGRPTRPGDDLDLAWHRADGALMTDREWQDPRTRTLQARFDGDVPGGSVVLVVHGGADPASVHPPGGSAYRLLWDSAHEVPAEGDWAQPHTAWELAERSMLVLQGR